MKTNQLKGVRAWRAARMASAMKNTSGSKSSPACCPNSEMLTIHPLDYAKSHKNKYSILHS